MEAECEKQGYLVIFKLLDPGSHDTRILQHVDYNINYNVNICAVINYNLKDYVYYHPEADNDNHYHINFSDRKLVGQSG